ncbi:hypothetical protein Theam_1830 (plasmid) [Thermovibrio ammonificans HB-1]|uniref:Rad52/22 double-strand break repair protein n=1 Tax=Thermovibrio ammonificans (strain DSM 15698 / JCM 12110 / HB-1) TaxID=648996 RepID=E8T6W3_THEA1|nr:Rad52/Rad22 family DNA repair protein [Thermovibrio ammonificans]ADU97786.1 hypothetical protein Theam_1830 [Thermovibrio ammonificans HB-1]
MERKLWELVEKVNKELDNQGFKVIQKIDRGKRVLYGFLPQAVFDSMNKVFGPENWGYEILDSQVQSLEGKGMNSYAFVRIKVWIKDGDVIASREAFGGSRNDNVGDALKGAITDAVQKGLAMLSVGRVAYEGELGKFYDCYNRIAEKLKSGDSAIKKAYAEFTKENGLGRLREWPLSKLLEFCEEYKIK